MPLYRVASPAKRDVAEILENLVEYRGGKVALGFRRDLAAALRLLASNPNLGHSRPQLTDRPLLFHQVKPYMLIYEPTKPLLLYAVLHGARDIGVILNQRAF